MFLICLEKVLQGLKAVEVQQMHGIYLEHNNRFVLFFIHEIVLGAQISVLVSKMQWR